MMGRKAEEMGQRVQRNRHEGQSHSSKGAKGGKCWHRESEQSMCMRSDSLSHPPRAIRCSRRSLGRSWTRRNPGDGSAQAPRFVNQRRAWLGLNLDSIAEQLPSVKSRVGIVAEWIGPHSQCSPKSIAASAIVNRASRERAVSAGRTLVAKASAWLRLIVISRGGSNDEGTKVNPSHESGKC
jgi:hypothetical protein